MAQEKGLEKTAKGKTTVDGIFPVRSEYIIGAGKTTLKRNHSLLRGKD